jgi:hypothetical protein
MSNSTPPAVLRKLAEETSWVPLSFLAGNRNTPPDILARLAANPVSEVRRGVAGNRSTPPDILEMLLADPETATVAADNPSLPRAALAMYQLAHGTNL